MLLVFGQIACHMLDQQIACHMADRRTPPLAALKVSGISTGSCNGTYRRQNQQFSKFYSVSGPWDRFQPAPYLAFEFPVKVI